MSNDTKCNRCNEVLTKDSKPPFGWELEDGEIVCHRCCVEDTAQIFNDLLLALSGDYA